LFTFHDCLKGRCWINHKSVGVGIEVWWVGFCVTFELVTSWTNVGVFTHREANLRGELKKETWGGGGKVMEGGKGGDNDNSKEVLSWRGLLKTSIRFGFQEFLNFYLTMSLIFMMAKMELLRFFFNFSRFTSFRVWSMKGFFFLRHKF
jgi:hypothetical protein